GDGSVTGVQTCALPIFGCSRGTVATLLARARERLRRRLAGRGLALPVALAPVAVVPAALECSTVNAAVLCAGGGLQAAGLVSARGRKSTRLNSTPSPIS